MSIMRTKQAPTVTMITVIALVLSMLAGFTFSQTSAAQVNEPEQSIAEFSALATYAVDLTALARAGKLETVRGRDAEIARVISCLAHSTAKAPVLIGESDLERDAVARGVAVKLAY